MGLKFIVGENFTTMFHGKMGSKIFGNLIWLSTR